MAKRVTYVYFTTVKKGKKNQEMSFYPALTYSSGPNTRPPFSVCWMSMEYKERVMGTKKRLTR